MTIREAVLAGVGIAALPEMMYGAALRAGQLSPVMPGWTLPAPQLYAVFVSRQGMVPAVRAFVDYLVEMLDPDTGKHTIGECPEAAEKRKTVRTTIEQSIAQPTTV
jgi:DNA-binding transcriptional LysR family regulator